MRIFHFPLSIFNFNAAQRPMMMSAPRLGVTASGGWEGAAWRGDEGRLILNPPPYYWPWYVLWLPKLYVTPMTWRPTDTTPTETFTAEFADVTGSFAPSHFSWWGEEHLVRIASPSAQSTQITSIWHGHGDAPYMHVTANVAGEEMSAVFYTEHVHDPEEVWIGLSVPRVFDVGRLIECALAVSAGETNGATVRLEKVASIAVDAWLDPEKTQPFGLGRTFTLESGGFVRIPFYVQADAFSTAVDQEWFAAEADLADGHHSCEARFTAISRIVEPINVTKKENRVVNPCCGIVGSNVLMKVDVYPQSFPAERIRWSVAGGQAEFVGGSSGKEVSVAISGEQDVVLSVDFGGCAGEPSVFTVMPTALYEVPVYACDITYEGGSRSVDRSKLDAMLAEVNVIYEQVGLRFVSADDVRHVENDNWNKNGLVNRAVGSQIRNVMLNTGGVEVYFITGFGSQGEHLGTCNPYGIVIKKSASAMALAHELGHACGLSDIYIERPGCIVDGNEYDITEDRIPNDWGSYDWMLSQLELIKRLLMYGINVGDHLDIPSGSVFGVGSVNDRGEKGLINVGRGGMTRFPPRSL